MKEKKIFSFKSILKSLVGWRSDYYTFTIKFGILFTILQVSDLTVTQHALLNLENRELNPFYDQVWFAPLKLTMVFLIMAIMYRIPSPNRILAKKAMVGMIFMYVFINMNNLYFVMK